MSYEAKAIEVMIASPSDVVRERQVVRDVITQWNAVHSRRQKICLMPVGWETHSTPELSGRAQQLINERLLESADLLVGIFWTRVGSPTGKSISGSIEEIERHLASGKPVMLYFSTAPVVPSGLDRAQYDALEQFKEWAKTQGLIETFDGPTDFGDKFRYQLQIALNENPHLQSVIGASAPDLVALFEEGLGGYSPSLSDDAKQILLAGSSDSQGIIMISHYIGGSSVSAGSKEFAEKKDRRSVARWVAAVEELYRQGLTRDINGKGEIFELNHSGYRLAETLNENSAEA
jgi:hypothetical protein